MILVSVFWLLPSSAETYMAKLGLFLHGYLDFSDLAWCLSSQGLCISSPIPYDRLGEALHREQTWLPACLQHVIPMTSSQTVPSL